MSISGRIPSSGDVTRLVLLALLSGRPMHGYELRREIELRSMELWADIKYGSIYPALRRMAEEELVKKTGIGRLGNRPPHTTYEITPAGCGELARLLRDAWLQPRFTAHAVDVALSFAELLAAAEITSLLEERVRCLTDALALMDEEQSQRSAERPEPRIQAIVADIFDHSRRLAVAEREWASYVLGRVRDGAYADRRASESDSKTPACSEQAQSAK